MRRANIFAASSIFLFAVALVLASLKNALIVSRAYFEGGIVSQNLSPLAMVCASAMVMRSMIPAFWLASAREMTLLSGTFAARRSSRNSLTMSAAHWR
jgi:uncharacterized protein YaiE (UPF0345 family)